MPQPTPLPSQDIRQALSGLPGWSHNQNALHKTYHFGSFPEAMSFMHRTSIVIHTMNHHPLWTNLFNTVSVRLSTHDAGNRVTAHDIELATKFERVFAGR